MAPRAALWPFAFSDPLTFLNHLNKIEHIQGVLGCSRCEYFNGFPQPIVYKQ